MHIHGMKICHTLSGACSSITPNDAEVKSVPTMKDKKVEEMGASLPARLVNLMVVLGYLGEEDQAWATTKHKIFA